MPTTPANSASLIDSGGNQLLVNTRGELVWLNLLNGRVSSLYNPEVVHEPVNSGDVHLAWLLSKTPRLDISNTFEQGVTLNAKYLSATYKLIELVSTGLVIGSPTGNRLSNISSYSTNSHKFYLDSDLIATIDSDGIHSESGVSAKGACDLSLAGGGGGVGTVTKISIGTNSTELTPVAGKITIPLSEIIGQMDDFISSAMQTALNGKQPLDNTNLSKISAISSGSGLLKRIVNGTNVLWQLDTNTYATETWVGQQISTASATYQGNVIAEDDTEVSAQTALAAYISGMDNNDYAYVVVQNTPSTGIDKYKRYKYVVNGSSSSWVFEYALNNATFSQAQWDALNSGATSVNIASISTLSSYFDSNGNAKTAVKFSSSRRIKLTGHVTGSADSDGSASFDTDKKGWSITTTIPASTITNSMLAGSIEPTKLSDRHIYLGTENGILLGDSTHPTLSISGMTSIIATGLIQAGTLKSTGNVEADFGVSAKGVSDLGLAGGGGGVGTVTKLSIGTSTNVLTPVAGLINVPISEITSQLVNYVVDSNYSHISVTSSSVSNGSSTFNKYVHPTTTASNAAAVKVGKDSTGHVVIGDGLLISDIDGLSTALSSKADDSDLTQEISRRKNADLKSIQLGYIKNRIVPNSIPSPYADIDAAIRFNHTTNGGYKDIPRGSDVDINVTGIVGQKPVKKDRIIPSLAPTAGSDSVAATSTAHINRIMGQSVRFNQLVNVSNKSNTTTSNITWSRQNGKVILNGSNTSRAYFDPTGSTISYVNNHIYLLIGSKGSGVVFYQEGLPNTAMATDSGNGVIFTCHGNQTSSPWCYVESGSSLTNYEFYPQVFDLTDIFGSGNEPSTVAAFRQYFPLPYYSYNAGQLISFGGPRRIFTNISRYGRVTGTGSGAPTDWGCDSGTLSYEDGIINVACASDSNIGHGPFVLHRLGPANNHVYYIGVWLKTPIALSVNLRINNNPSILNLKSVPANQFTFISRLEKWTISSNTVELDINTSVYTGLLGQTWQCKDFMLFDLTALFGEGNEPETEEEVEMWLKQNGEMPYYPYNVDTELAYPTPELVTVGRNAWDEIWEQGTIATYSGSNQDSNIVGRSKNYIPILPDADYEVTLHRVTGFFFYDSNYQYLGQSSYVEKTTGQTLHTPSTARYMRFLYDSTSYENDVCIALKWSQSRTGYESHEEHRHSIEIPIPDEFSYRAYQIGELCTHKETNGGYAIYKRTSGGGVRHPWGTGADWTMVRCVGGGVGEMLSVPNSISGATESSIYDESISGDWEINGHHYNTKFIIRIGTHFVGNAVSEYGSTGFDNNCCRVSVDALNQNRKYYGKNMLCNNFAYISNGTCSKFTIGDSSLEYPRCWLYFDKTDYPNLSSVKSWLQSHPTYVYYQLNEPIVLYYDSNMDYWCDDYGTEEIANLNYKRPQMIAPKMDIVYGINVADEIRGLPGKYVNKEQVATNDSLGLIRTGYVVQDADSKHLQASLALSEGKGFVVTQLGWQDTGLVFNSTPNFTPYE